MSRFFLTLPEFTVSRFFLTLPEFTVGGTTPEGVRYGGTTTVRVFATEWAPVILAEFRGRWSGGPAVLELELPNPVLCQLCGGPAREAHCCPGTRTRAQAENPIFRIACEEVRKLMEREGIECRSALVQRVLAETRTTLADLRDTLQQYATATTLDVPAGWDYPGIGGGPTVEQLERRDIGGPAREALQRLQAGPYTPEGPLLGLATTAELVEELQARLELRGYAAEDCLTDLATRCRVDDNFNAPTVADEPTPPRPRCAGPQPVYDGQPRIPDFVNPPPR